MPAFIAPGVLWLLVWNTGEYLVNPVLENGEYDENLGKGFVISTRSQIWKIFHISISQMRSRSKAMINVRTISFYLGVRSLPMAIKVLQQGKLNKVEEGERRVANSSHFN